MNVRVPAFQVKGQVFEETTVQVRYDEAEWRYIPVYLSDELIGYIEDGTGDYSPKAAGHGGRIARFHKQVRAWKAYTPAARKQHKRTSFDGYRYPNAYGRNTRRGACAYLIACAAGVDESSASYFNWER